MRLMDSFKDGPFKDGPFKDRRRERESFENLDQAI